MSRARNLGNLGNENIILGDTNTNRVGIGSTIPDAKLDVVGVVSATTGNFTNLTATSGVTTVGFITATDAFVSGIATATTGSFTNLSGTLSGVSTNFVSAVGIQSAGTVIGAGITQLNFVGSGNTLVDRGNGTLDISISGGGGGGGGLGTALSDESTELLSQIFTTTRNETIAAGTSVSVEGGVGGGNMAFTKLGNITVATGATFHVSTGTTFVMNVLNIF
tara:strand:+ start:6 stop:668 length:663 start_codon:yes stop_codon:yes gene_type:complete